MNSKIKALLDAATSEQLRALIEDIYEQSPLVDNLIQSHLIRHDRAEDSAGLSAYISQRIAALSRGRAFIDWHSVPQFSHELDTLIRDIKTLIDCDPHSAFNLIDKLLSIHDKIYERVDDSSGIIGESLREAVSVWLAAASACRQQNLLNKKWPETLKNLHVRRNNYAVWDELLANSTDLLTVTELTDLAEEFEAQLVAELQRTQNKTFDSGYLTYKTGLLGIAHALKSVELYTRAVTMVSPQPNPLQIADIIRFCLHHNQPKTALSWHQKAEWRPHDYEQERLLDDILVALGDSAKLREVRQQKYEREPSYVNLQRLIDVVPKQAAEELLQNAAEVAFATTSLTLSLAFLFELERYELAAKRIIADAEGLNAIFYSELVDYAKLLSKHQEPLAASLVYRALINSILADARSKAYTHAARYFRALVKIDQKIINYAPSMTHADYVSELKQKHGRKRAFWSRVDG